MKINFEDTKINFSEYGLQSSENYANEICKAVGKFFIEIFKIIPDVASQILGDELYITVGKFFIDKLHNDKVTLSQETVLALLIHYERGQKKSAQNLTTNDSQIGTDQDTEYYKIPDDTDDIETYKALIYTKFTYSDVFYAYVCIVFQRTLDKFDQNSITNYFTSETFANVLINAIRSINRCNSIQILSLQIQALENTSSIDIEYHQAKIAGLNLIKYLVTKDLKIQENEAQLLVQKYVGLTTADNVNNLTLQIITVYVESFLQDQSMFYQQNTKKSETSKDVEFVSKCFNQCIIDIQCRISQDDIAERTSFYTNVRNNINALLFDATILKLKLEEFMTEFDVFYKQLENSADTIVGKLALVQHNAQEQLKKWNKRIEWLEGFKLDLKVVRNFYKSLKKQPFPEEFIVSFVQAGESFTKAEEPFVKLEKEFKNWQNHIETPMQIPQAAASTLLEKILPTLKNNITEQYKNWENLKALLNLPHHPLALLLLERMHTVKINKFYELEENVAGLIAFLGQGPEDVPPDDASIEYDSTEEDNPIEMEEDIMEMQEEEDKEEESDDKSHPMKYPRLR